MECEICFASADNSLCAPVEVATVQCDGVLSEAMFRTLSEPVRQSQDDLARLGREAT